MVAPRAGRRGQQQVAQVGGEDPHRLLLGRVPAAARAGRWRGRGRILVRQAQPHGLDQPGVAGPAALGDAEAAHDCASRTRSAPAARPSARLGRRARGRAPPPSRRGTAPARGARAASAGLGEVEIVGELGAGLLPCPCAPATRAGRASTSLAQRADEVGILGEALDQDGARALERGRRRRRRPCSASTKPAAAASGSRLGSREQRVGQRPEPGLAGDLRLGAALGLERQVEVLEPRLGVGGRGSRLRAPRRACPARAMDFEHRGAPLLEFAQIGQPLLERAQLRVVERRRSPPCGSARRTARSRRRRAAPTAAATCASRTPSSAAIRR